METRQWVKFFGWCGAYVALPVAIYVGGWIIAWLKSASYSLSDILEKGDLLFVVVVLLATTVDWTVIDLMEARSPSDKGKRSNKGKQLEEDQWKARDYLFFLAFLFFLMVYIFLYGSVISETRIPAVRPYPDPERLAHLTGWSFLGWTCACGLQCFFLLKKGRI